MDNKITKKTNETKSLQNETENGFDDEMFDKSIADYEEREANKYSTPNMGDVESDNIRENKKVYKVTEAQLKNYIVKILKEETSSGGNQISEKNKRVIDSWIEKLGHRGAAKKLIDYHLNRISGGLTSSDLGDTVTFADGLDEIEGLLQDQSDYKNAMDFAKDTAMMMLDDEGFGSGIFDEGFKNKKESWMKTRAGATGKVFENESMNQDPTKKEMLDILKSEMGGFEGTDDFSAEEAIYWYAYNNHGGQHSNLYSALSTSEYKPSRLMKNIDDSDDEISLAMYNTLVDNFGGEEMGLDSGEIGYDDIDESDSLPSNYGADFNYDDEHLDGVEDPTEKLFDVFLRYVKDYNEANDIFTQFLDNGASSLSDELYAQLTKDEDFNRYYNKMRGQRRNYDNLYESIDMEKTKDGYLMLKKRLSNGDLFKRKYMDYTEKEAKAKFKKEYDEEENKNKKLNEAINKFKRIINY